MNRYVSFKEYLAVTIATVGQTGFFGIAPGTVGSLYMLLLQIVWICPGLQSLGQNGFAWFNVLFAVSTYIVGVWSVDYTISYMRRVYGRRKRYDKKHGEDFDYQEIIIDEVHGQAIAGTPVFFLVFNWPQSLFWLCLSFVLFRLFDIFKPWPIKIFDNKRSKYGVMNDDTAAGFLAGLIVLVLIIIF